MKHLSRMVLGAVLVGLATGIAWSDLTVTDVDWQNVGNDVEFHARFYNPDAATSLAGTGEMNSRPYGAYLENYAPICTFDIPPIPPDSFFDVYCPIPLDQLPPSALEIISGGVGLVRSTCPPDLFWDGNVDVDWMVSGMPGQIIVHNATLLVCIGSGPSYIHLMMNCLSAPGVTWGFTGVCSGWTASLLTSNAMGQPGGPAPATIPPGLFDGWIQLTAGGTVADGDTCCVNLNLSCGTPPMLATVQVCGIACFCDPVSVEPGSWGRVKALYR